MSDDFVNDMRRASMCWIAEMDRDPLIGSVVRGDASREAYVTFLRATYHYVRWSGPILASAAEGLRRSGRSPWLADLFARKSEEESPHDGWLLHDLGRCGANVELVKASAAPSAVSAYVSWSMALAEEGSSAFLGAAYALESISMERATLAARNLRAHGVIPRDALSFLEGHGEADPEHVAALHDVLRRIDDARERASIALSASVLHTLYPCFFRAPGGARATPGGWLAAA